MGQCDSLITKLITMLLDWDSGDIYLEKSFQKKRNGGVEARFMPG